MVKKSSTDTRAVLTWTPSGPSLQSGPFLPPTGSRPLGRSIGLAAASHDAVVQTLRQGLAVESFAHLQKAMALTAQELASTAHIAVRTLGRRKREGRFRPDESERLWRLGALFDWAVEVLEGTDLARQWFTTPKRALGGQTPLAYADTEPGAREVENLLGRLEHGVFS